jgi:hypothetical protein
LQRQPFHLGPGVPGAANVVDVAMDAGSTSTIRRVLIVKQDCLTVTGTIIDATAPPSHHQPDGVRHEPDGDTHGWLQVDSSFASLINAGNTSMGSAIPARRRAHIRSTIPHA